MVATGPKLYGGKVYEVIKCVLLHPCIINPWVPVHPNYFIYIALLKLLHGSTRKHVLSSRYNHTRCGECDIEPPRYKLIKLHKIQLTTYLVEVEESLADLQVIQNCQLLKGGQAV